MPGFLFHVGAIAMCPHGGQVSCVSSNTRVLVMGQPVATLADQYPIAGCTANSGGPQPCVMVQWLTPATRVLVNGQPAILQTSTGITQGPMPGPPVIVSTQTRVVGT